MLGQGPYEELHTQTYTKHTYKHTYIRDDDDDDDVDDHDDDDDDDESIKSIKIQMETGRGIYSSL